MRAPRPAVRRAIHRASGALACAALLTLAGCARTARTAGVADPGWRLARGTASDVTSRTIQGQALAQDPARSMLDVLASYWPTTMRGDPRALQLGGDRGLGVYINGNYMGGWDFLRTVRAGEVTRVQRLSTSEEYMRFGRGSANGAVVLSLRGSVIR